MSEELKEALGYATSLLVSFVHEHCEPVDSWKPQPDLIGVLTQIDNATTVVRDMKAQIADKDAEIARLRVMIEEALDPYSNAPSGSAEAFWTRRIYRLRERYAGIADKP